MNTNEISRHYHAVRQTFDAPWPGPQGQEIKLENEYLSLSIFPEDGCRITTLNAFGYELLRQWQTGRKAFQYGCFPMVPWVGRLGNATLTVGDKNYCLPPNKPPHALHGMACFAPWQTIETGRDYASFRLALFHPWPWDGHVTQQFSLDGDTLIIILTIESAGERFPAAAGWHPWFSKWTGNKDYVATAPQGDSQEMLQVSFDADWQEEPGDNELPTGNRIDPRPGPWDDCFGFKEGMSARLCWPGKVQLEMNSAANSMVVFDRQPDATCVEPLSVPPNGVNTHQQFISPGKPLVIETRWKITDLR